VPTRRLRLAFIGDREATARRRPVQGLAAFDRDREIHDGFLRILRLRLHAGGHRCSHGGDNISAAQSAGCDMLTRAPRDHQRSFRNLAMEVISAAFASRSPALSHHAGNKFTH
jgi:hypothetical protein